MLNPKVSELINAQVTKEFYSAYLYLDFANYYYEQGLDGFANWYDIQAQEERDHAMLMRAYLHNNGAEVKFGVIDQPNMKYETYITAEINKIYRAADDINDYRTMQFFDWFIKEQGEEEKNAEDMIRKYELFGKDPKGLYALNQELAARVYAAPSLVI